MPSRALPEAFISRRTEVTVSGSASIMAPMGLMRARSTSTHGDLAAARRASMEWQEQPWARMIFFCLASSRTSMTGR